MIYGIAIEKNNLRSEFGFDEESIILAGVSTWRKKKCWLALLKDYDSRIWIRLCLFQDMERRMEIGKVLESSPLPYQMLQNQKKLSECGLSCRTTEKWPSSYKLQIWLFSEKLFHQIKEGKIPSNQSPLAYLL